MDKEKESQELVKEIKRKIGEKQYEILRKQVGKLVQKEIEKQKQSPVRKGEFAVKREAFATLPSELLRKADDLYICSTLLKCDPRDLKLWQTYKAEISELRKALDTETAGEGAEWIPTEFSREIIERVRLQLKVAALHPRIDMPTNPYKLPVAGADAVAYLVPEALEDEAVKIKASTPGTKVVTLYAKKLGARTIFSEELSEDAIVPILPYIKDQIVTALATAQETATINGDTSATHLDADVTSSWDARKAWDGYRKLTLPEAKLDLSTFNTSNLRALRAKLGKYGVDPAKLAWVCSISVYNKFLSLDEVITVDKYGPNATILRGELAKLDNIPVIVSEYVREDLNASGVYDGTTTDRTIVLLVYRPGFIYGDRRKATLRTKEDIETDQTIVVSTQRLAFEDVHDASTETLVALGYNIAT